MGREKTTPMFNYNDRSEQYFRTVKIGNKTIECYDIAAAYREFFIDTHFELSNPCDLNDDRKVAWFQAQPNGFELLSKMQASRKQGCKATKREYWESWLSIAGDANYDPIKKVIEADTSHLAELCQAQGSFPRRSY